MRQVLPPSRVASRYVSRFLGGLPIAKLSCGFAKTRAPAKRLLTHLPGRREAGALNAAAELAVLAGGNGRTAYGLADYPEGVRVLAGCRQCSRMIPENQSLRTSASRSAANSWYPLV